MEFISKDDAQRLITVLDGGTYNLTDAATFLGIRERLQAYIDQPDNLQIKMVDVGKAEAVPLSEPMEITK